MTAKRIVVLAVLLLLVVGAYRCIDRFVQDSSNLIAEDAARAAQQADR